MSVIHSPKKPEINIRMISFLGVMYTLLLVVFLRLWYFQVVKAPLLADRALASKAQPVTQIAPRGLITDRNGKLIGQIKREIVIKAVPASFKLPKKLTKAQLSDPRNLPDVIQRVIALLNADPKKVLAKFREAQRTPRLASPIFVGATIEQATKIAESPDQYPGVVVDTLPMRSYTDSKSFTHVLGYVWTPNKSAKPKPGRPAAEYVGKAGIEKAYETDLMGMPGAERWEMDAKGQRMRLVGREEPTPGKKLVLTLDADLQRYATQLMGQNGYLGGVVAMDPSTGEVLCLVSNPTFDAQLFQGGLTDAEWKNLSGDPNKPMLDRAISSSQSPGSTFKIVTSLAAFEKGKFSTSDTIVCPGGVYLNGKLVCKCLGVHGAIDFKRAFMKSCNTYFATLGYSLGQDALLTAAKELGLGAKTGIEIDGERAGIVPTDRYLKRHKLKWRGGDTINLSIGQGYVAATPLQMCNLVSMVANGGVSYRPHLVREIVDPLNPSVVTKIKPEVLNQAPASPEFWETIRDAMVGVIESGTGMRARIPGIVWGGKTGSTENGKKSETKTHAWFVGVAPIDHPKIAIAVLIENVGHGGDFAAPVASDLVHHYLVTEASAVAKSDPALAASTASVRSPASPANR
jgi:penicillin-binding protein 2